MVYLQKFDKYSRMDTYNLYDILWALREEMRQVNRTYLL